MNIPEEWPTEEMLFAAREACDDMFQTDFIRAFKAALAAAPTPPAQPHQLDDADIRAIALDCGFKLKPQPDGLEDLNPYVYRFAREILSTAPRAEDVEALRKRLTPPAQDDEQLSSRSMVPVDLAYLQSLENDLVQLNKIRNAAEELFADWDDPQTVYLNPIIRNLRAALEGK